MLTATFRGAPQPPMQAQRRGRSRHVSPVALARQASEERRRSLPPITESPQSLKEQIQVAYALDDIRLAKILLLRLQGIYVTDDADPRIDQVRDEDFDVYFAPSSPLSLDATDKRALHETQRRQRHWWHESQRTQRLRACEKLWEDEKSRLHAERRRTLQRREHDSLELERTRPSEKSHRATKTMPRLETSSTKRDQDPFQYAFMLPSKPSPSTLPAKSQKKGLARSPGRHSRCVAFKEVINAMNGQLFPLDAYERADDARRIAGVPIPNSNTHRRRTSARAELLDSLLQAAEWQQGERRKAKGKDIVRDQQVVKSHFRVPTPLPSIPSSLSATSVSSSSSSPSRSNSWLTFGSWRSTATDITAPDSPVLASPAPSLPCLPTVSEAEIRREPYPRSAFVRISLEESPLCPSIASHPIYLEDDGLCTTPSDPAAGSVSIRGALVKHVTRSVATIIEAAKGLQSAYIAATMFSAGSLYMDTARPPQPHGSTRWRKARREGYRALPKDVRRFTDSASCISQLTEPVHFIPLVSHPSGKSGLPKPPIPKDAVIFPSPLRPRTPPTALGYRMRPVANPAVLRLRALQNIMCARGKEWEGRAREGGLGCGKERMLGIAFEGRGRSGLGCEVRFVVA